MTIIHKCNLITNLSRYALLYAFILIVDFLFLTLIKHSAFDSALLIATYEALALTTIFVMTTQFQLTRLTLAFLALPYFFFFLTWLNIYSAVVMTALLAIALFHAWKLTKLEINSSKVDINWQSIVSFLSIVLWVHMSGSGGYSYQSPDYSMHNSRLEDLINFTWPIRYEADANLVYYIAYYLPSAIIGKLTNFDIALRSMLPWTVLGVTLTARWLCQFTSQSLNPLVIMAFILFGPLDFLGLLITYIGKTSPLPHFTDWPFWSDSDQLDFWATEPMTFFIGNYLSNTFQLYWSPHQIIAGWLCAALLFNAFQQHSNSILIFSYALLCLWSPMIMLALTPVFIVIAALNITSGIRSYLTIPNIISLLALVPFFLIFYMSGSATKNPHWWTILSLNRDNIISFLLLHILSWGLYSICCLRYIQTQTSRDKILTMAILSNFLLLSLLKYGAYSDLLCRGSAPISFLLFILIINTWHHINHEKNKSQKWQNFTKTALVICLVLGSGSAILQNKLAINHYGELQPPLRALGQPYAYEFLGEDDSLFGYYFRRPLLKP